ncbi:helix-turn-helix domain-containing protein [Marinigracilibium pacificum]|uniref:Helix-turn-helix domain-containing protein n=1 Tax=Marinigracilibium pacificum TaxID=2729599 RepID=A0A848J907_9BACT|nr:helix-turn-helix domain-containing protein [Marinigracilibium pacificum]NMM50914.1 helix-turn-helix domain-containing protein [Marinigracilibium pacificum]
MFKRKKYNYEFRLSCVRSVLEENRSVNAVADEYGIENSNLRLWVRFFQQYGKSGLKPRKRQSYDALFKFEVIESIEKDYLSLSEACVKFNIPSESIIINWQRAYKAKGLSGLKPQSKGRPKQMNKPIKRKKRKSDKPLTREEQLEQEVEYLRAENELLKKLQALVQKDKKQKP